MAFRPCDMLDWLSCGGRTVSSFVSLDFNSFHNFTRDFVVEVNGIRDMFSCIATVNYNLSSGAVYLERKQRSQITW